MFHFISLSFISCHHFENLQYHFMYTYLIVLLLFNLMIRDTMMIFEVYHETYLHFFKSITLFVQ